MQSVTGVKGLKQGPKNPARGAGGDLNFAKPHGSRLVMAVLGPATLFKQWKARPGFAGSAVTGAGDAAFADPAGPSPCVMFLRKGDHAASVSSFLGPDMAPLLSQGRWKSIAKIIAARL